MLNISDNHNMLIVNDTNHVIINDTEPVEVLFRYLKDINVAGGATEANNIPYTVGLEAGPVIKSYSETPVAVTKDGVSWMKISIVPNRPTSIAKTQSFSIVDGNGLGRTINLILRSPWEYSPIVAPNGQEYMATVAPGNNNLYNSSDPAPQPVSAKRGEPLSVYFNLPDGLESTVFPLEFYLESKHQWIENNQADNLVVNYGASKFNPNVIAISYIKTVSYEEYLYSYFNDGTNNLDINSPNVNHTVRCRFLTIADASGEAEIKIHCEYFEPDVSVTFQRK